MSRIPSSKLIPNRLIQHRAAVRRRQRRLFLERLEERSLLATMTWDGSNSALWSDAANWVGDIAPAGGDDLFFPAGAANLTNNNDLGAGTAFNTILFTGGGYNITGNAISLVGGLTANNVTGNNTFTPAITLANGLTLMSANPGTTLTLGAINTVYLEGATNFLGNSALNFDGAGTIAVNGVISGAGSILKLGDGTTILRGANTYTGLTDVRQGFLRAENASALGPAGSGDTQIQAGAQLQVAGTFTIPEHLALREGGVGFGSGTDASSLGALRGLSGTVTWTGNMDLAGGNNLIGVDAGATIIMNGVVANATSATNRLHKVGGGTLRLGGTQANVYRGETFVLQGTLELAKTAGLNAIGGSLTIGDNIGGDNAATVRLITSNQLPHVEYFGVGLTTVTMNSSGLLDFNNQTDTIGNLTMVVGSTYAADIDLNGGTLVLGGLNLTLNQFQGSSGVTPSATIADGTFDLGTFFSGAGGGVVKSFAINDTQLPNIAADLTISANITGTADIGVTKTGGGTLVLSGNNTFAGPFSNTNGIIGVGSNNAFGSGLLSLTGGTLRAVGADRTIPTTVSLDGTLPVLGDLDLTFTGATTLTADRTIQVMDPNAIVTFAAPIGEGIFASRSLNKAGRGTLNLTAVNTFSGTMTVNSDGGTLTLSGNGSLLNANAININQNGVLRLDNSGTNNSNRVNDVIAIGVNGGEIVLVGNATAAVTETTGPINTGDQLASTITVENTSAGAQSVALVGNALGINATRTINFRAIGTGAGGDLSATGPSRIVFQNNPGNLLNGVLAASRTTGIAGTNLATLGNSPEGVGVVPIPATAYTSDFANAGPLSNVRITAPGTYTLTSSKQINSLMIGPGVIINGADVLLNVTSGIFHFLGAGASAINVESINMSNGSVFVDVGMTATIGGNIVSTVNSINKSGAGRLSLTGDNTFAGTVNLNQGIVNVQRSTALGSPQGATTVRQGATLEIEQTTFGPVNIGLEQINVAGVGVSATGQYADAIGALRNVAGTNSLAGRIGIGGDAIDLTGATLLNGFTTIGNAIGTAATFINVEAGSRFISSGDVFNNGVEVIKRGAGTLEYTGVFANTYDQVTRILEGTLDFNKDFGINSVQNIVYIGSDRPGAPAATLKLSKNEQIRDGQGTFIHSSGLLDIGQTEGFGGTLTMVIASNGAADIAIGAGGTLTTNVNLTVATAGTGHATGATISGGTVALQYQGTVAAAGTRTWEVNDGAVGTDLTVTSAVVDGTGLQSVGIFKNGFGTLELGGTTANTFTGLTTVNEGTLLLNKGSGAGGVSAMAGPLTIGDANVTSGFAGADVVRWLQSNQLADYSALVSLNPAGRLELNGRNDTIGGSDTQNALVMQAASTVDLGGGTLTLNGNILTSAANGAGLWTPVAPPRIVNGTMHLGNVPRVFEAGGDRSELTYELDISANLTGTAGFLQSNTLNLNATIYLAGNNSGLSGEVYRGQSGHLAVGSDTAFGTGKVFITNGNINPQLLTFNGPRSLANEFILAGAGALALVGGNGFASSTAIGGGGNNLMFTGPVNVTGGLFIPVQATASTVEFAGGLGETFNTTGLRKHGPGTLILSSPVTFSSSLDIGQDVGTRWNGGTVVLRGNGTYLNVGAGTPVATVFQIGTGGTLQIDNSQGNLPNRIADSAAIDLFGGTLALIGGSGVQATESLGHVRGRSANPGQVQVLTSTAPGSNALWRFTSTGLEGTSTSTTIKFVGRGQSISNTGTSRLAVNVIPTAAGHALVDGILPYGVMQGPSGFDFVTIVPGPATAPFDNFITALTSGPNFGTSLATASATVNVKLTASEVLAAPAIANAVLLANGGIVVSGNNLTVDTGTIISNGVGNQITAPALALNANDGLFYVNERSDLSVSSNILLGSSLLVLGKSGQGALTLSGASTFNGLVRVAEGTLRGASNTAFGSTVNGVTVTFGGTLELSGGITVPAEALSLTGNAEANLGALPLRNVSGVNTWLGNVALNSNRTAIDVAAGQLNIGDATNTGIVSGQGFNKFGPGTLRFAGNASNTFAVTSLVWNGTLELGKTGVGVFAIPILNDNSELFVGSFWGANDSATLSYLGSDQIADVPPVQPLPPTLPILNSRFRLRIMQSGQYNLNGFSETIEGRFGAGNNHDVLGLEIGSLGSGDINLGGGTLRIGNNVAENGRIQVRVLAGGFGSPATISNGTLELTGSLGAANGARRILVDDSSAIEDLVISATIADGVSTATSLIKNNAGRLVLAPTAAGGNTYTIPTIIEGGELVVRHASALGSNGAQTTVNNGFSLLVDGVSLSEPMTISGAGFGGQGVIRNLSGNNTLSGNISMIGSSVPTTILNMTFAVNAGTTLDLSGVISETATAGVNKLMPGTLTLSGTGSNSYTGTTTVSEGTLLLNKTGGAIPFNGALTIGNDAGSGSNLDVVQLGASDQIPNSTVFAMNSTGRLNLGTNNETLGAIALTTAGTYSPILSSTGAGTLTLGGDVTLNGTANAVFTTRSPGATFAGRLDLANTVRTFTINETGFQNAIAQGIMEAVIDASIIGNSSSGIISNGSGMLVLTNNNTLYSGTTTISGTAGVQAGLALRNSGALGSGPLNIAATSNLFFPTYGAAPTTITINNPINLNADLTIRGDNHAVLAGPINGLGAANRSLNLNVNNNANLTISGNINLSNDATARTFIINTNTFNHEATISGALRNGSGATNHALQKGGAGTLILAGDSNSGANNDFIGITTISGGFARMAHNNAFGNKVTERQSFTVSGGVGTTFTITYNTQVTTAIPFDGAGAPPALGVVEAALNALPAIGRTGLVTVTGSPGNYTVEFTGLSGINVNQITAVTVTGGSASAVTTLNNGDGGTIVNGGTLQLIPGLTITEPLSLNGAGIANRGALRFIDVTPGTSETTTLAGPAQTATATFIGVDGGGANPDRLIVSGYYMSIGGVTSKVGAGELEFGGNTDNFQSVYFTTGLLTGFDDGFEVRSGTAYFNKPANFQAVSGGGTVTVGDGGGGVGGDRLILLGASNDHIGGNLATMQMVVGPSGSFSLAGAATTESIPNTITLQRWLNSAGIIDTSATRTLNLGGNISVTNSGYSDGATPAAQILGQLNTLTTTRSFGVADSQTLDPAEDLVISAVISSTSTAGGFTKDGYGTAALTAANTYQGTTSVNAGSAVDGLISRVGGTLIARNAGVLGTNNLLVNQGATLTLNNTAANVNRIADAATVDMRGVLNLIGNSAGTTELVGTTTINVVDNGGPTPKINVDSAAGGVTELQLAGLVRGANSTIEFEGTGANLGATTNSRIQVVGGTSPFVNNVMTWATVRGPAGLDLVTEADAAGAPFYLGRVTTYSTDINTGGIVRLTGVSQALTANRIVDALLLEGGATITGNFDLQVGTATAGLIYSPTGSNNINLGAAGELTYGGREPLYLVNPASTLTVNTLVNSTATLRLERGGTLVLAGDNDQGVGNLFTGAIVVNQGTLRATHAEALGSATATTSIAVNNFATLSLEAAISVTGRALVISGPGVGNNGALAVTTGNTVTWTNPVAATTVSYATSPVLLNIAGTLVLNAVVTGGGALTKIGAGNLEYAGSFSNTTSGTVSVNEGTLTLNKGTTFIAIPNAITVTVDDLLNFDRPGSGTLAYGAAGGTNNIVDTATITVNDQGQLLLNGASDTITTLNVNGSRIGSDNVATGAGTLSLNGNLTMSGGTTNGNIRLNAAGSIVSYSSNNFGPGGQAIFAGVLDLNASLAVGQFRTITVNDNYALNDLVVTGTLINGRVLKNGTGSIALLNAANSLTDVSEIQTLTITGVSSFTLSFNGVVTPSITTITAPGIQTALETILGVGNVSVSGVGPFNVAFTGSLAGTNVAQLVATVTGGGTVVVSSTVLPAIEGASGFNLSAGTLALASTAALGGGTLNISGSSTLRPIAGTPLNLTSRVVVNPAITTVIGGRRDFGGTDAVTLAGPEVVIVPVLNGTANSYQIDDPLLNVQITAPITGGARNVVNGYIPLVKTGFGKLILSGNSTFVGHVQVSQGILNLRNSNALSTATPQTGAPAGAFVNVLALAALELEGGVTINDRTLILNLTNITITAVNGYQNNFQGALRSLSGANVWRGAVELRSDATARPFFIGVDAGSLSIDGSIVGSNAGTVLLGNSLIKVGAGSMIFEGGAPNLYTGATAVLEGTLVLQKSPGVNAIAGTLIVGDNSGTDIVEIRTAEQIVNTAQLQVQSSGQVNMIGVSTVNAPDQSETVLFTPVMTTGVWSLRLLNSIDINNIAFNITPSALESLITQAVGGPSIRVGGLAGLTYTFTYVGALGGQTVTQANVLAAPVGTSTTVTINVAGGSGNPIQGAETVNTPQLIVGANSSGTINIGASSLILNGDVTVTPRPGIASAVAAQILGTGSIALLPPTSGAAARLFTVNDGAGIVELNIVPKIIDKLFGTSFFGSLTKAGAGRLSLAGDNEFGGVVTVTGGALRILHPNGLGDNGTVPAHVLPSQSVIVNAGAALEFDLPGTNIIDNEYFSFSGSGIFNEPVTPSLTSQLGTGAVRNLAGNNTLTVADGNNPLVTMPSSALFNVAAGRLIIDGILAQVATTAAGPIKSGAGDLEFAGSASNRYQGNTIVNEGKLVLNKTGTAIAVGAGLDGTGAPVAPGGELFIGDVIGGDNSAIVEIGPLSGGDQVNDSRPMHVSRTGRLNLNNQNETISGSFFLDVGPTMSGDVVTGTGVLTMTTNTFYAINEAGLLPTSPAATLQGNFNGSSAGNRIFTAYEGPANIELDVQAVLAEGATPTTTWTKQGRGTVIFSGNNTYVGTTTVNTDGGTLVINGTSASVSFSVNPGATLGGNGTISGTVTANNHNFGGSVLRIGGTINPGTPGPAPGNTGILTVNGNVTFGTRAELFVDLNGNTPGTGHDVLRITAAGPGALTINTTANNGSNLNGNTGSAIVAGTGVKVIDMVAAIPANIFTTFFANAPGLTGSITLGTRSYSYVYNDNSGLPLGNGNDLVLTAIPSTVVWDGRVDGGAITVSNNWTLAANWVGDAVPSPGDAIMFNDIGIGNGKNLPFNDFPALSQFGVISFANTSGSYTVTGNSITLALAAGANLVSDNTLNIAVSNSLNVAIVTATSPQSIIVKDGSTLTLGGAVTLVAAASLTVNNGAAGPDASGSIVFGGTVNGAAALNIDLAGDATFNAAVGGVTPLTTITITNADDVTFNSTVTTTGNLVQSAGTGATTISGGTIGGLLTINNESVALAGGTTTVTGNTTLNATVAGVSQTAGALITPSLTLTGVGVFSLPQAANDFNSLAANVDGAVTVRDTDDLLLAATGITTTNDDVSLQTGTTLGINGPVNLGTGDLTVTTGAATTQTAAIIAGGLELKGAGPFTLLSATNNVATLAINTTEAVSYNDATGFVIGTVTGTGTAGITTTGDNVTLGAGGAVTQTAPVVVATLTLQGAGPFTLTNAANDATSIAGNTTGAINFTDANSLTVGVVTAGAAAVTLTALTGSLTDGNAAANNITAGALVATAATGIGTLADPLETTVAALEAAGGSGGVFIVNTGALVIGGVTALNGVSATAGNINISSTGGIAVGETITSTGTVTLNGGTGAISTPTAGVDVVATDLFATATTGIDLDTDVVNVTLTNTGAGNVVIDEANALNIAGLNVANGSATINATGALSNSAAAILTVSGNASFAGTTIALGDQAGDNLSFGSLTFNSAGAVIIDLNNATALSGASTADSLLFNSTGAINNLAGASLNVANAVTLNAASVALGSQAGDTINFGTLNFNSTGAVNIAEDSSTSIIGTNTAGSANIVSTAALANAAGSSIVITGLGTFGGTTVNVGNAAGDTFNAGSVGFTSTGAVIITEDSGTDLAGTSTAGSLVLTSPGAITSSPAANVAVTGAVTFSATAITIGNQAGDLFSFGTINFTATTGGVTIEENSALQLTGANTAPGAIVLTSVDAVAAGQDLVLPAGSSVTSSTSSVTLNAGDNATIAGSVTSTLATTINIDFGDAESPAVIELVAGTGAQVVITGVITTPNSGVGGGAFLNGNDDFDVFTFTPQTTTQFFVDGNAPTGTATGDVLQLDTAVTTNPLLMAPGTVAPYNGTGSGSWTFSSAHQPVLFTNIEENSPPSPFHLTIDNSGVPIGNIVIMRDLSQTRVQIRANTNSGPIIFQGLLTSVLSVRVLGSSGDDIVTVDDINTLPDFQLSVPGVNDNPNLAGVGEILFDGMGGNDTFVFNLNGPSVAQTYAIGVGASPGSQAGELLTVGSGISLPTYFQNVELVQRIGTNAALGTSDVAGDAAANTFLITASGALTRVSTTGYVPYEIDNASVGQWSVNGGVGSDTIELISLGTGAGNPAINLNGGNDIDTLQVHSTSTHTGLVTLSGGLGSDIFRLHNAANRVDEIVAPVIVDGTDGLLAANNDQLTINNSGAVGPNNIVVGAVNAAASADYRVDGMTSTAGNDFVLRNIDALIVTGTQGNDLIDAQFVNTTPAHDLSTATINGWLGADQFLLFTSDQVGGTSPAPTGSPSGLAAVNLNGDAPGNPNPGDGNDVFGQTAPGLVGTGAGNAGLSIPPTLRWIRPSVSTAIAINGGRPTGPVAPTGDTIGDVLNLDLSALPANAPLILATVSGVVATTGVQPLSYAEIEDFNLALNNQLVNVQMGDLLVRGTNGADLIQFMRNPQPGAPDQMRIRLNTLVVDVTTTGKTLVFAGAANDYVTMANVEFPGEIYGETGDDYISGAMANDFLVGGLGNDQINASGGDNIVWGDNASAPDGSPLPQDDVVGGDDVLSALDGNDVFYGGGGNDHVSPGAGNDYVYGGEGNDLLDGHLGDDRVYGGGGNDVISGSSGNDLLVGGAGSDQLMGRDGNDVLIGGDGADLMTGDGGDDLIITGQVFNEASSWVGAPTTTTFDAGSYARLSDNDAALMLLLSQWASLHDKSSLGTVLSDGDNDTVTTGSGDDLTYATT